MITETKCAPTCACSAGDDRGFPAQHATMCPRFGADPFDESWRP